MCSRTYWMYLGHRTTQEPKFKSSIIWMYSLLFLICLGTFHKFKSEILADNKLNFLRILMEAAYTLQFLILKKPLTFCLQDSISKQSSPNQEKIYSLSPIISTHLLLNFNKSAATLIISSLIPSIFPTLLELWLTLSSIVSSLSSTLPFSETK